MPDSPAEYVVGEQPTNSIRIGVDRTLAPDEFAAINLYDVAAQAVRSYGHQLILHPEREAQIQGVRRLVETEHGEAAWGDLVDAFGEKLFTNFLLGGDLLVVPPGSGFPPHVHPGHHLLLCLAGPGTFSLAGTTHTVGPGDLYMVEGGVPHAVGNPNGAPHIILAIGAPPKELDAEDRMTVVEWDGVPIEVPADGPIAQPASE